MNESERRNKTRKNKKNIKSIYKIFIYEYNLNAVQVYLFISF